MSRHWGPMANVVARSHSGEILRCRLVGSLLLLAGLVVLSWPRLGFAQGSPNLLILSVPAPVPPGSQAGGQMLVQAIVRARTLSIRPSTIFFYLAQNGVPGPNDIEIATAQVDRLSPFFGSQTVAVTAPIPVDLPPGFYYVLACTNAESNCIATPGTIPVVVQAMSAVDQPPGSSSPSPPAPEYFPENPADGMTVGSDFDCPISSHGQYPGTCVFVTTKVFKLSSQTGDGLMYCPANRPYPYQVFFGSDPLWEDLTKGPTGDDPHAETRHVSFTKYKLWSNVPPPIALSYAGFGPGSSPPNRGYAAFRWVCGGPQKFGCEILGQVRFLCSDKPTNSAEP
jgi:hypothetical protein